MGYSRKNPNEGFPGHSYFFEKKKLEILEASPLKNKTPGEIPHDFLLMTPSWKSHSFFIEPLEFSHDIFSIP